MSRMYCLIGCIALIALLVAPATAETTRLLGMGGTGVGLADTSASAGFSNPASLPYAIPGTDSTSPWPATISFTGGLNNTLPYREFDVLVRNAGGTQGFSVGYENILNFVDVYGASYGHVFGSSGISAGASWIHGKIGIFSEDTFNIGLGWRDASGELAAGVLVTDVSDVFDTDLDIGLSGVVDFGSRLNWGIDLIDVGDANWVNVGVEYVAGPVSVQVGAQDWDMTAGVGYDFGNLAVGLAWQHMFFDEFWTGGVSGTW